MHPPQSLSYVGPLDVWRIGGKELGAWQASKEAVLAIGRMAQQMAGKSAKAGGEFCFFVQSLVR